MKKIKLISVLSVLCAVIVGAGVVLSGCGSSGSTSSAPASSATPSSSQAESSSSKAEASSSKAEDSSSKASSSSSASKDAKSDSFTLGDQLSEPVAGDTIAIISTTQGDIKIKLFPEQAPKAVENFTKLAEQGDYDGCVFHRIIDGFMIQTGNIGKDSIYGGSFEDEFSDKLVNIRGSVSMANAGPNTNSTQFFINQATVADFPGWDYYQEGYSVYKQNPTQFTAAYGRWIDMSKTSDEYLELYEKNGGNPTLDGAYTTNGEGHTVFGQVYEGMDVVDAIAKAKTDSSDAPTDKDSYKITSIKVETFEG